MKAGVNFHEIQARQHPDARQGWGQAMESAEAPVIQLRLRFIDMARACAILLMLEGHFVDVCLADQWRTAGHPVYDIWLHLRGLAAPMFFTVTGLIFAYLLASAGSGPLLRNRRVRRGLLRVLELFFWGYALQINLGRLPEYLEGKVNPWVGAFHVLQCIGAGLGLMILLHGLLRNLDLKTRAAIHLGGGFLFFVASILIAVHPESIPAHAPAWLQNAIKGKHSPFPIAPWLGFTLYGAAIGMLIRHWQGRLGRLDPRLSPVPFLVLGMLLKSFGWSFDDAFSGWLLQLVVHSESHGVIPTAFHGRVGEILLALGLLVWIEKRFPPKSQWLERVGRNTFPIYVIHVIILYGGIFGIGINDLLRRSLNPWQAAAGAVLFCSIFALGAQWMLALGWIKKQIELR
ncbi:MAG: heparan-alpha-glucosaminide N-acetyltransferase domain-containing protein [Luteolibacter sp.]